MKKQLVFSASIFTGFLAVADTLVIEPQTLNEQIPVKVTLTLDAPADSAYLELKSYQRPFHLNGSDKINLTPSSDKKTFTAEFKPESFYHPVYAAGKTNGGGASTVAPELPLSEVTARLSAPSAPAVPVYSDTAAVTIA